MKGEYKDRIGSVYGPFVVVAKGDSPGKWIAQCQRCGSRSEKPLTTLRGAAYREGGTGCQHCPDYAERRTANERARKKERLETAASVRESSPKRRPEPYVWDWVGRDYKPDDTGLAIQAFLARPWVTAQSSAGNEA